eukprot:6039779-Pyramimonas_sp.AAC.1
MVWRDTVLHFVVLVRREYAGTQQVIHTKDNQRARPLVALQWLMRLLTELTSDPRVPNVTCDCLEHLVGIHARDLNVQADARNTQSIFGIMWRQTDSRAMLAGPKGRAVGESGELDT